VPVSLTFLGAAGTVTGSKLLLQYPHGRVLVDCGLYRGERHWRRLNWEPLPVPASSIGHVVLTHAHLDHSGYLPALLRGQASHVGHGGRLRPEHQRPSR
jgi:metallo-beta-lactamase family protein